MRRRRPLTAEQLALPTLDEALRVHVLQVVDVCGGNRVKAARILRIDRKTLYRMLARWGRTSEPEI